MPVGAVTTKRDESLWDRAKGIVDKQRRKRGKVSDYWALVMHVYQRLKGAKKSEGTDTGAPSVRLVVGEKKLRKSLSTHPIKLTLDVGEGVKKLRAKEEPDHPYHGFLDVQGIPVHVENKRGSVRRGPGWKTKMGHHYGEIRGTRGVDGDAVDAYVGKNHDSNLVVVVHQKAPGSTSYDEDKVMLGFDSVLEALKAYRDQYDKPGFYGTHTAMSIPELKRWIEKHGHKGRKLTKAQRELLELVKADPFPERLTVTLDLVKAEGGLPIGHVSTRKDGSQWRKKAPGEWEQIRLQGGVKAVRAKSEHYHNVSEKLTKKAFGSPAVGRKALYSGGAAAAKALAEGKGDDAAKEAFVEAFKNVGGHEGLIGPDSVNKAVKKIHGYAIARASMPAAEAKPEAGAKPAEEAKPAEAADVVASPEEREQKKNLEDAGLDPQQVEAVQGKVEAPPPGPEDEATPQELVEGPKEEPVAEEWGPKTETKDWPKKEARKPAAEGKEEEAVEPEKKPKEPAAEAEKPWDEMSDKEKKKAHEKLKAEHAELLLLKEAVKAMEGMALDPRKRAYHRVLKFMKKAVAQSKKGEEPTGAQEAKEEAKKTAKVATGKAKRFFDRLADKLARFNSLFRKSKASKEKTP